MKDSRPTWQDFEIPKGNFASKIRGTGSSMLRTVRAVGRNKRRSMSMISGLILGFSILAGILLYSAVMMNNVYDTVVRGSPYEIRFDFKENVSDSDLENYRLEFAADSRVADAQVMYGNGRMVTVQTATSISTYTLGYLRSEIKIEETETRASSEVRIIDDVDKFLSGEIGSRFKELVQGDRELSTDRGIWVARSFAEAARVQVGSKMAMNVTIEKYNEDDFYSLFDVISQISLTNITIAGIVDLEVGASAGLFSGAIFSESEIFLPSTLFIGNESAFLEELAGQEMRYCVLKIDESKFNLADLEATNSQINSLINSFEADDPLLVGSNLVQEKLLPFQIMNMFILVFDFVLTIPVVILSVYLLSFGIDLALEERRYQVGVFKTQGASGKQVKRKIIGETLFLAVFGIIIGYVLALIGAWGIGTARGYMKFDWDYAISQIGDFLILDITTIYLVGGFIIITLLMMANGKSNKFIEMEISETVRRADEGKKENWLRRNNLDIGFFAVGLATLAIVFLQQAGIAVNLGPVGPIIAIFGPFLFWIGGAACVARLAIWLPTKTDRFIKRLGFLKDVNVLVKGNVFRKSGEIPRLALIIALTVSFAVLAAVQGTTGEVHQERQITWSVGSDLQVTTGVEVAEIMITSIKASDQGIQEVMAFTSTQGILLNDYITVHSIDADTYEDAATWQSDNFPQKDRTEQLKQLADNKTYGCLIGEQLLDQQALEVGREIEMEFMTYKLANVTVNGTVTDTVGIEFTKVSHPVKILGTFDHLPGGIGTSSLVVDHHLINSLYNLTPYLDILDDLELGIAGSLIDFSGVDADEFLVASTYLVKTSSGASVKAIKEKLLNTQNFPTITTVKSLEEEIRKANELQNVDYGIPGLLTMDFIVSLLSSTLATFIFMSILMEKRKKEFAIMRSYGASKGQVYKVVFSETIIFLLTAITWGLLIGLGLALLFNGFFEFIEMFVTPLSVLVSGAGLKRLLIFDWFNLLLTLGLSFASMLLATYFSVRGALKANISTVVRQL